MSKPTLRSGAFAARQAWLEEVVEKARPLSVLGLITAWETWMDWASKGWTASTSDALAEDMARHMGVSYATSSLYRRAFEGLGLIAERPGRWNDGDPTPASVEFLTTERSAARTILAKVTQVYVTARYRNDLPAVLVRLYSDRRLESPTAIPFFSDVGLVQSACSEEFVSSTAIPSSIATYCVAGNETNCENDSRESDDGDGIAGGDDLGRYTQCLTIQDLSGWLGKSRAQTYRLIPKLIEDGTIAQVKRGRWKFL